MLLICCQPDLKWRWQQEAEEAETKALWAVPAIRRYGSGRGERSVTFWPLASGSCVVALCQGVSPRLYVRGWYRPACQRRVFCLLG